MRALLKPLLWTLAALIAMDLAVAILLREGARIGLPTAALQRKFDHGRSVPGQLAVWSANPGAPGNLANVAWLPGQMAYSRNQFGAESGDPLVRGYGMSFVNRILRAGAVAEDFSIDLHAGPGAPPNFVYAAYLEDAGARRSGDVVVLGLLSSAVPSMFSFSNRTWAFEQPAPFTYPVFRPSGPAPGLTRIDPVVKGQADEAALGNDPVASAAWDAQLKAQDPLFSPWAFMAVWADVSPFLRLVRLAMANSDIDRRQAAVLNGGEPVQETLSRMVVAFADQARAESQIPIVVLVQTLGRGGADLRELLGPVLAEHEIPTLATADLIDAENPINFLPDGHFLPELDVKLGAAFNDLLQTERWLR